MRFVNIGFGNLVNSDRVISVVSPDSAPVKRIITDAKDRNMLIDATHGRRTRAVVITDSDHVVLTFLQPETIANRFNDETEDNGGVADVR